MARRLRVRTQEHGNQPSKTDPHTIDGMIERTYTGNEINRVGIDKYLQYFRATDLELLWLNGLVSGRYDADAVSISRTKDTGLSAELMSGFSLEFALRKSDFDLRRIATL